MTTVVTTISTALAANGTAPLPFTFQALSAAEIAVTRNGVAQVGGFDIDLNGDGTGAVTPLTDWGTDAVVISSDPDYTQLADFGRFAAFYPDQIVPPLDRLARTLLVLKARLDALEAL